MNKIQKRIAAPKPPIAKKGTISGHAALFNQKTELMPGVYEMIAPQAFRNTDFSQAKALFNHDPNKVLASVKAGTLKLTVDEIGLRYEFKMPNTSYGNDLLEMIRRGDIDQSSFAFTVTDEGYIPKRVSGKNFNVVTEIDKLFDVSPVTYPAYEQTTVSARSKQKKIRTTLQEYELFILKQKALN